MLFDPKWGQTKANPLSLVALIAWLEKQPADDTYCYLNNGGCLLHKFFTAHGFVNLWVGGWTFRQGCGETQYLPDGFRDISSSVPHTFGAALERARILAVSA